MATPSSSNTTPSPSLANLLPITHPEDREQRQRAVGKFMARAEISMVTRVLRARLSYASYKAAHNVPHASLQQLEEQIQAQAALASRAPGGKRRTGGAAYYSSQPDHTASTPYPFVNLVVDSPMEVDPPPRPSSSANLFVTLLTPPVPRPRTVHNANDPLPKAAVRPEPLARPRARHTPTRSIAEGTRAQAKHRREERAVSAAAKRKSKKKASSKPKGTGSRKGKVDGDGDVDMKAAAALTLLYQHRPSSESPRSSTGSSDEAASQPAASTDAQTPTPSHQTTPPPSTGGAGGETSPSQPPDKEAADLMLFLATSPSPVRPKTTSEKDAKDLVAFRTLSAGLKDKGRVLFPSEGEGEGPRPPISPSRTPRPLSRAESGESSFASMSSIGGEMDGRSPPIISATLPTSPTPQSAFLQPPATLHPPSSPLARGGKRAAQPATPGTSFNLNEYIHVSPSPRPAAGKGSLRADVGRKLFEEEQIRQQSLRQPGMGQANESQDLEERELDAGIDLGHG